MVGHDGSLFPKIGLGPPHPPMTGGRRNRPGASTSGRKLSRRRTGTPCLEYVRSASERETSEIIPEGRFAPNETLRRIRAAIYLEKYRFRVRKVILQPLDFFSCHLKPATHETPPAKPRKRNRSFWDPMEECSHTIQTPTKKQKNLHLRGRHFGDILVGDVSRGTLFRKTLVGGAMLDALAGDNLPISTAPPLRSNHAFAPARTERCGRRQFKIRLTFLVSSSLCHVVGKRIDSHVVALG